MLSSVKFRILVLIPSLELMLREGPLHLETGRLSVQSALGPPLRWNVLLSGRKTCPPAPRDLARTPCPPRQVLFAATQSLQHPLFLLNGPCRPAASSWSLSGLISPPPARAYRTCEGGGEAGGVQTGPTATSS